MRASAAAPGQGNRLRHIDDTAPARWVEESARDLSPAVPTPLPAGFEAYARVLHPAEAAGGGFLTWRDIAARSGRDLGAGTRFAEIAGTVEAEPRQGSFPEELLPVLCDVLASHTSDPEHCVMGLWDGWGWIGCGDDVPRADLGSRAYLLYEGPVGAAADMGERGAGFFFPQSPNLWWPGDRSWCVATDVDLDSTFVGGSARLIGDLTGGDRLEALAVDVPGALRG
ncbi:hypothetical protein [Streptomyces sp. WMMB 322]|uniref:hypothetical protein n=1 Tax=Streptomyces sp. WMMB 322 TaxID=1286821 RepID=UPI0006E266F6|nr:hypothetical protein [Streptomyces sp. WMMB 322]SCK52519.1 hypothetical protein H180DRAFT_04767 [Streptomyces sp. WMMB 322]